MLNFSTEHNSDTMNEKMIKAELKKIWSETSEAHSLDTVLKTWEQLQDKLFSLKHKNCNVCQKYIISLSQKHKKI